MATRKCFKYCLGPVFLALTGLSSGNVFAMYKCSDGQGGISYSQLPCEQGQQSKDMSTRSRSSSTNKVCAETSRFAIKVVKQMRRGAPAAQVINRYGGLDLISKAALGIINYVYTYRLSENVSAQKIAALTVVKCNGGNFGELGYADIPGAIDPDSEEGMQRRMLELEREAAYGIPNPADKPVYPTQSPQRKTVHSSERKIRSSEDISCKRYQKKLEALDDKMRSGYSVSESNSLREQRRRYKASIKEWCK